MHFMTWIRRRSVRTPSTLWVCTAVRSLYMDVILFDPVCWIVSCFCVINDLLVFFQWSFLSSLRTKNGFKKGARGSNYAEHKNVRAALFKWAHESVASWSCRFMVGSHFLLTHLVLKVCSCCLMACSGFRQTCICGRKREQRSSRVLKCRTWVSVYLGIKWIKRNDLRPLSRHHASLLLKRAMWHQEEQQVSFFLHRLCNSKIKINTLTEEKLT